MTRLSSLPLRLAALLGSAAIIAAACGGATPSASAPPGSEAPSAPVSEAPFDAMVYPADGEAPCGQTEAPDADHSSVHRQLQEDQRHRRAYGRLRPVQARMSRSCPKIAFSSFAINDSALARGEDRPVRHDEPGHRRQVNGTGPYKLEAWNRGSDITMVRNDAYWGDKAMTEKLIVRWSNEAAQRLVELQSGTVDGIDNVGTDRLLDGRRRRRTCSSSPARA